jgi:23S rRNA (uridine2552-2'-O)-methyltransferase
MYNPYDHYFQKAKEQGYKARSAFKLEEIQEKFHLFDKKTKTVIDIGCAPGSWMQYTSNLLTTMNVKDFLIVGFDIKKVDISIPHTVTYVQDVTDHDAVKELLGKNSIQKVDFIQSDMAPNTIGTKDVDAMRSFALLEQTLWIYEELLAPGGKFVTKLFMGPGFDEYLTHLKKVFGGKNIKTFKPKSCRKESKEIYVIKV